MSRQARLLHQCLAARRHREWHLRPRPAFELDQRQASHQRGVRPDPAVPRWRADRLDAVIDEIAATGFALTLGIHSRIDDTVRYILDPGSASAMLEG